MTFFLNKQPIDPTTVRAPQPSIGTTGMFTGISTAATQSPIGLEANFGVARRRQAVRTDANSTIIDRIGEDAIWKRLGEKGMAPQVPINDTARKLMRENLAWREEILGMGKEAASAEPESWADVPLTEEQWETETNKRLQAEYAEGQEILSMMPSGRGAAEFIGQAGATVADVKNAPFLLLGGGSGSLWRIATREAAINMAAEAVFLPGQFDMAERLEIPDPNVMQQLAFAALAGAGFGVGLETVARANRYVRGRNTVAEPFRDRSMPQTQAMVDTAEDVMAEGGRDALTQLARIPERIPRLPPYRLENPINPERPPLVARPEDAPAVPEREDISDEIADDIEAQADDLAREATRGWKSPLLQMLKRQGVRIDPKSTEAQDLYAILGGGRQANNTVPGLFRKGGAVTDGVSTGRALDNLPASEWEEMFPGISAAAGVENSYLSSSGVMDLLRREAAGDSAWMRQVADAQSMRSQAAEMRRSPQSDFLDGKQADGGYYVNIDAIRMNEPDEGVVAAEIAEGVTNWMQREGYFDLLLPEERAEIIAELQRSGGDADYLVEQALSRELDFARAPDDGQAESIPFDENDPRSRGAVVGSDPFAPEAGGGAARGGRGAEDPRQYERTDAGEQRVAPGIAPITERQRLEAAQNAPMRGGSMAADDGLFDLNARAQTDMFDPDTPAFQERSQQASQSFRDEIEANGDFSTKLELEDGRTLARASDVLDYLDEVDDFAEIIALCGNPKGAGA